VVKDFGSNGAIKKHKEAKNAKKLNTAEKNSLSSRGSVTVKNLLNLLYLLTGA